MMSQVMASKSPEGVAKALIELDRKLVDLIVQRVACVEALSEASTTDTVEAAQVESNHSQIVNDVLAKAGIARSTNECKQIGEANPAQSTRIGKRDEFGLGTEAVFRQLDALCRESAAPVRVAFLGPLGTYTHDAVLHYFGSQVRVLAVATFAEIFAAIDNGTAHYGVAPIENSTEGAVNQTHDLLVENDLQICGEVRLRIRHSLMSRCENLADIRAVHAHPQSLAQCRQWLLQHLPNAITVSESSNAAAAALAKEASPDDGVAAIASASAANRFELFSLAQSIEDIANNTTRFVVLGRHQPAPTGHDATSLLISAPHKPGGLRRMLQPLEDAGVSMTRIESRPARTQLWEYVFFIDVTGHCQDPELADVLTRLKEETPLVRVLGSYPRAT
jgi:chorismate mutase / prephenate dehydratase